MPASSYSELWLLREAPPVPGTSGLSLPIPGLILVVLGFVAVQYQKSN